MDSTEYIHRSNDSIALTGISFTKEQKEQRHSAKAADMEIEHAYDGVPAETFNITLSHIPQHWDDIVAQKRADLTLSGHVHAMQMKLPTKEGRGISPSRILYKRWSGLYEEQGRWLYINDGIGCIMYPDDHDGNDHDDPECLVVLQETAAARSVIVVVTHRRLTSLKISQSILRRRSACCA